MKMSHGGEKCQKNCSLLYFKTERFGELLNNSDKFLIERRTFSFRIDSIGKKPYFEHQDQRTIRERAQLKNYSRVSKEGASVRFVCVLRCTILEDLAVKKKERKKTVAFNRIEFFWCRP
jgi:hypothetical protein